MPHLSQGFPGYVARIKWNNPKDVLKLYSVLAYLDQPQRISKFPIEVGNADMWSSDVATPLSCGLRYSQDCVKHHWEKLLTVMLML